MASKTSDAAIKTPAIALTTTTPSISTSIVSIFFPLFGLPARIRTWNKGLEGPCDIPFTTRRSGGPGRARSDNQGIMSSLLYQLSYRSMFYLI